MNKDKPSLRKYTVTPSQEEDRSRLLQRESEGVRAYGGLGQPSLALKMEGIMSQRVKVVFTGQEGPLRESR